ncbi:MAG: hypothetical protein LUG21_00950 [Clostridiales bacterium]|nr:hypothetical protein [Clostridiales bacterium]
MAADRRNNKTKQSIKSALIEMLKSKSAEKITVTELAENANIGRKTFYLHYQTIFDVFDDIDNDVLLLVNTTMDKLYVSENETNFDLFLSTLDSAIKLNNDLFNYFILSSDRPRLQNKIKDAVISVIKAHSSINQKNDAYVDLALNFTIGGIIQTYLYWYNSGREADENEVFEICSAMAVKAYNLINNK